MDTRVEIKGFAVVRKVDAISQPHWSLNYHVLCKVAISQNALEWYNWLYVISAN